MTRKDAISKALLMDIASATTLMLIMDSKKVKAEGSCHLLLPIPLRMAGARQKEIKLDILCRLCRFNSKVVRFKERAQLALLSFDQSFNSKVVRFKVNRRERCITNSAVSIPKWCDSKSQIREIESRFMKFQFQSGAIQRSLGWVINPKAAKFQFQSGAIQRSDARQPVPQHHRFNSKVVRFKVLFFRSRR